MRIRQRDLEKLAKQVHTYKDNPYYDDQMIDDVEEQEEAKPQAPQVIVLSLPASWLMIPWLIIALLVLRHNDAIKK